MATPFDAASTASAQGPALPRRKRRGLVRFVRNRAAVFGAVLVALVIVMAVFAPWLTQYDPVQVSFMTVRQAPSAAHWFGTDELGRDVLSRLLYGARASLLAGVVSVGIAVVLGVPLGLIAGYFGKLVDGVISRVADALLSIPILILAIALSAFLGPSLTNAMAAIGISAMPRFIRLTRGQAISVKAEEYVEGARDRPRSPAHHSALHSAQRAAAHHRAGEPHGGERDHR